MKKLTLTILALCLLSIASQAQTYDFLGSELKRMTINRNIQIDPMSLDAYLHTGEKVSKGEIMNYLMMVEYQAAIYSDSKNDPKAIIFEKASEEAKAMKIKRFENMTGSDFMLNQQANNFELQNLVGNSINLESLKGEVVLLNFWFVGCKPCIMEMPELNELVEEFKPEGVKFLAIGLDNVARVNKFLETHEFNYELLPNGRRVATDYGIFSYPTHLLINEEGKVIFSQVGYFPGLKYALRKQLKDALK